MHMKIILSNVDHIKDWPTPLLLIDGTNISTLSNLHLI